MESEIVMLWLRQCEEEDLQRQIDRSRRARAVKFIQPAPQPFFGAMGPVGTLYKALYAYGQKRVWWIKSNKCVKAA